MSTDREPLDGEYSDLRDEAADEHADGRPAMAQAPRVDSTGDARVLIADDNEDAATMLGMFLELCGCEVAIAHDGRAAVELAERFRPRLAVIDLGMPHLNGFDCARELRSRPWCDDVLLVALTGWGQEQDRRRSREAGFDHHLVKPVEPDVISQLLHRKRGAARPDAGR
jgi:CheY-like chemotaxis protein